MSFVQKEEQKLDDLVLSLNSNELTVYSQEIDYIRKLLELLRKQKQEEQTATTKKEKEKVKKKEKETKDKLNQEFNQLINAYTLKKLGNVTHKLVPEETMDGAKLVKASAIYNREGLGQAEAYLQNQGLDNWAIDPLSTKQTLVLKDGDQIRLASRGTDLKGKNINDLDYDVKAWFGKEMNHNILVDGRKQVKAVKAKYPNATIKGHGYSLGANTQISLGNEFDYPTETYNSYVTKNIVNNADRYTGKDHVIWRTTDDLPSIRSTFLDGVGDFTVNTVPVLENSMSPIMAHRLENFTTNNRSGKESNLQVKLRNAANETARHGEMQLLNQIMHDTGKKKPVVAEPEEPEEIEDTLIDRRLKPRTESSSTRFWDATRDEPKRTKLTIRETGQSTNHLDGMGIDKETLIKMKALDTQAKSYGKPHPPLNEPTVNKLLNSNATLPDSLSFVNQIKNRQILKNQRQDRNLQRNKTQIELDNLNDQLTGVDTIDDLNKVTSELMKSSTRETQAKNQFDVNRLKSQFNKREFLRNQLKSKAPSTEIEMKSIQPIQRPIESLAEPIRFADMTSKPKGEFSLADELNLGEGDLIGGRGFLKRIKTNRTIEPNQKQLLIKKRNRVKLPDGDATKSSSLSNQIDDLENQITSTTPELDTQLQDVIDYAGTLSPPKFRPDAKQTFTEWARQNGVSETDHKKSIWELSGNDLTEEEKVGYKKSLPYNDEDTLNDFVKGSTDEKASALVDSFNAAESSVNEVDNLIDTPVRGDNISKLGNVARETFKGIHPMNVGISIFADSVANGFLNVVDEKHKQPEVLRTAERGFLSGGIASTLTGGELLPEAIAGGASYLAGTYTAEGVDYGLEALGVNKDVSEGIGSTVGGVAGGITAVSTGSLASAIFGSAAVGAEEGAVAGGGIFSAETMAIGGIVGGVVGLGSYLWSKFHG